ncbi:MAG TPA: hypothetical protein VNL69_11550 [Bacteroidota bacterium]|nr:hypothetical protein [Bacteroidota bacterium]
MKYMQTGSFQSHPLMRLTLSLTLLFLIGFVATNFALYFSRMSLDPASVVRYYNGSEEDFHPPRSVQSMLEVTHGHLPMMAMVLLLLTHLTIFTPFSRRTKTAFIVVPFLAGLLNEGSGWLVRFLDPGFAWLKVVAFVVLQGSLILLLLLLSIFLVRSRNGSGNGAGVPSEASSPDRIPTKE